MNRILLPAFLLVISFLFYACQKDDDIFNSEIAYGTLTDIEGNDYRTVTIGSQVWMAENLRTTLYNDGTEIILADKDSDWSGQVGSYCWYNNRARKYKDTYGALYNWTAVGTGKLCPSGWHVPDFSDWRILQNYLIDNQFNYDRSTVGNKIAKSLASPEEWEPGLETGSPGLNPETNNRSGFSALPAGFRDPSHGWNDFKGAGTSCGWWSSTLYGSGFALHASLSHAFDYLHIDDPSQTITIIWSYGFSVRCIKNNQ